MLSRLSCPSQCPPVRTNQWCAWCGRGEGQCRQTCGGTAQQTTWVQLVQGQNDDNDIRQECRDNGQMQRPPPGSHPSPRNQEAKDDNDGRVRGGGGDADPSRTTTMMTIAASMGFGDVFPLPIGRLQPGGVGERPQRIPCGWRRDDDVEQRPQEGCVGNQYEERCRHRRMVGGSVTGGNTTISQGEATVTRHWRYNETTMTTMNVTMIGATSTLQQWWSDNDDDGGDAIKCK